MSMEIITKAIEEHGEAVAGLKKSVEEKSAALEQRVSGLEGIKKLVEESLKKGQRPGLSPSGLETEATDLAAKFASSDQFGAFAKGLYVAEAMAMRALYATIAERCAGWT